MPLGQGCSRQQGHPAATGVSYNPDGPAGKAILVIDNSIGKPPGDFVITIPSSQVKQKEELVTRRPINDFHRTANAAVNQSGQEPDVQKAVALNSGENQNQTLFEPFRIRPPDQSAKTEPAKRRDAKRQPAGNTAS
jgi:hypothetical protein